MNPKKHPDNHWGLFQFWADIHIFLISFSFSYPPISYTSVLVIFIYFKNSLVISFKDTKKYIMPNFNTGKYLSTLISIRYPSILYNKIEQFFSSRIYPDKVTSPKVQLARMGLKKSAAVHAEESNIKHEGEPENNVGLKLGPLVILILGLF